VTVFDAEPDDEPIDDTLEAEAPSSARPSNAGAMSGLKDALIAEVQRTKAGFYRMTVAQAQSIEVIGDRIVFSFGPTHKFLKDQLEQSKTWMEPLAARVAGRRMHIQGVLTEASAAPPIVPAPERKPVEGPPSIASKPAENLAAEAAADPDMKTLLELIPLEIKSVERL
jgi:hypothetical protein